MKPIDLYSLFTGTKANFLKPFQENENLHKQADTFWNNLDGHTWITIMMFIVLGILMAIIYYKPYNNKPGRHYTPLHWMLFLGITAVLTFLLSYSVEYIVCKPSVPNANMLEFKIALGNTIYASLLYFISSIIWCYALPTNAYRLFKF